ncbi:hypothetical protein ACFWFF_08525 [Streptomyces sp. NPDC060223]|uniref:hypothetical protein n=1 Tax=unclassified Streptomyces TaxID=2593676 RepID=UPI00362A95CA
MNGPARPFPPGNPGGPAPKFLLGVLQIAATTLGGLLAGTALANVLLLVTVGEYMTAEELRLCLSSVVIASVVCPVLPPRFGVELTPNWLVVRGNRRRQIAWRDIIGLEIRKTAGIRTVIVAVSDGRRIVLRAPMSLLDRRFDHKVQVLMDWWVAGRGGPGGG